MNAPTQITLLPAEPVLDRLYRVESRLAAMEAETKQLRRDQPDARHTTREGACGQLGIRLTKLHELITDGHLATVKVGRRTLITQESIDRFLAFSQKNSHKKSH